MPVTPLVQVDQLSCFYQRHRAVHQLSFTLEAGEVLGFLGPNGAGKSTSMQIITGNLAPSAGRVRINGLDMIESPRDAKQHIGYLPEHPPIYRDATVDEYLKYCAQLRRVAASALSKAVTEAKKSCGLDAVGHRLIGRLSKGYQQRVGIAQAIIHRPPVVILDEPTVGLDPIQVREIRSLIKNLGAQRSVILSTHILSEVQAICDRVQIIHQGELVYQAPIETLNKGIESSVMVSFRKPPAIEGLQQIDGITHVEAIDHQRFRLHFDDVSPAEQVVTESVIQGWGLFELTADQRSLEDLFIELTDHTLAPADRQK